MRVLLWNNTQKVPCHDVKALPPSTPPPPPPPPPPTLPPYPKQTVKRQQVCVIMTSSYTQRNIPEEALHAILVACTRIFLCVPEELLVHALVEGVPQEVAPEAVQPVHLIRQTWTCQCSTHNSVMEVWQDAAQSQNNIDHDLQPRHGAMQHVLQCFCCQTCCGTVLLGKIVFANMVPGIS